MLRVLPPGSAVLPRARKCLLPVYTFILLGVDYLGWLSELRSIGARSDGLGVLRFSGSSSWGRDQACSHSGI